MSSPACVFDGQIGARARGVGVVEIGPGAGVGASVGRGGGATWTTPTVGGAEGAGGGGAGGLAAHAAMKTNAPTHRCPMAWSIAQWMVTARGRSTRSSRIQRPNDTHVDDASSTCVGVRPATERILPVELPEELTRDRRRARAGQAPRRTGGQRAPHRARLHDRQTPEGARRRSGRGRGERTPDVRATRAERRDPEARRDHLRGHHRAGARRRRSAVGGLAAQGRCGPGANGVRALYDAEFSSGRKGHRFSYSPASSNAASSASSRPDEIGITRGWSP